MRPHPLLPAREKQGTQMHRPGRGRVPQGRLPQGVDLGRMFMVGPHDDRGAEELQCDSQGTQCGEGFQGWLLHRGAFKGLYTALPPSASHFL